MRTAGRDIAGSGRLIGVRVTGQRGMGLDAEQVSEDLMQRRVFFAFDAADMQQLPQGIFLGFGVGVLRGEDGFIGGFFLLGLRLVEIEFFIDKRGDDSHGRTLR